MPLERIARMGATAEAALSNNTSAGHLRVRVEDDHPVEVPFLFDQQRQRIGRAQHALTHLPQRGTTQA
jgi:hypothetical protein